MTATALPISEDAFQRRIIDYCQMRGLLVFHDADSRRNQPGFPDLVIVGANRVLFRELKTDKGTLRQQQIVWLRRLHDAGEDAGVWRPKEWAEKVLPELQALTRPAAPAQPRVAPHNPPSSRSRHEEKITVYLDGGELLAIEQARVALLARGIRADRSRLVRAALALALPDLDDLAQVVAGS